MLDGGSAGKEVKERERFLVGRHSLAMNPTRCGVRAPQRLKKIFPCPLKKNKKHIHTYIYGMYFFVNL